MPTKIILKAIAVDENGNTLSEEIISNKEVFRPTDCSNFGYNQKEQLEIMRKMQQALLDKQADFLKSTS